MTLLSDFFSIHVFSIKEKRYWLYLYAILIGFAVSSIIISYRYLLGEIDHFREVFFLPLVTNGISTSIWFYLIISSVIISFTIAFFMKKYPLIRGGGVPFVKGVFSRQLKLSWSKDVLYKFITGLLALLAGCSLGIEGPSIQLGAETAEGVAKKLKKNNYEKQYFVACGASAGISAAFHAPLTGAVFVVEELVKHISPLLITCTLISSVIASWLSNDLFGLKPFFIFSTAEHFDLRLYYLIIIFAFLLSLLGKLFSVTLLGTIEKCKNIKLSIYTRVFLVITLSIILSIYFFDITGGGHELSEQIIVKSFSFKYLFLVLFAKGLFTILCTANGIPGGIFVPMMSLGVIAGKLFGMLVMMVYGENYDYSTYFMIMGMSSFLTSVLKTPLTATVLAMEVTGSFNHFFPVIVSTMLTLIFSDLFKMKPLYDHLLKKMLKDKKSIHINEKMTLTVPIGFASFLENKLIKEVPWPNNIIITEIIRGEEVIIPNGKTKLLFGDLLIIFTDSDTAVIFRDELMEWGESGHF